MKIIYFYKYVLIFLGIGYIKKLGKNQIQWVKESLQEEENEEVLKNPKLFDYFGNNKNLITPVKNEFLFGHFESDKMEIDYLGNELSNEDKMKICEIEILKKEIDELQKEEEKIDSWINQIKSNFEKLNDDKNFKEYGYVSFDDIKALTIGEDVNLIAVRASPGTSVEIPDPEHIHKIFLQTYEVRIIKFNTILINFQNMKTGREEYDQNLLDSLSKKYQIFLDSPNGEINVYLVLTENQEREHSPRHMSAFTNSAINNNNNLSQFKPKTQNLLQENNSYRNLNS